MEGGEKGDMLMRLGRGRCGTLARRGRTRRSRGGEEVVCRDKAEEEGNSGRGGPEGDRMRNTMITGNK